MLLRDWLTENRISQSQLSRSVGCTPAMLNYILNRKSYNIKIDLLRRIHRVTGLSESELISDLLQNSEDDVRVKPIVKESRDVQIDFTSL